MAIRNATALAPVKEYGLFTFDPFFTNIQQRMNRVFGEDFGKMLTPFVEENWTLKAWTPACDIYETENEIIVKAELPEVKKENVTVTLENNILTIKGERKLEEETRKENYHRVERAYGEFVRNFTLPNFIEPEKVVAEFKDGMLRVMIPKRAEAKPKQVEVKVL